jgi:peptidoglycan-associated lipoprotein
MRILFALPIAVLFGCAHQSEMQPAAQAAPPPSEPQAAAPASSQPMAAAQPAKPMPQPVAGADPASNRATCGLVRVHFATDSSNIPSNDKALLSSEANCLRQNKELRINVEGNADERGPHAYNENLGERRAQAVSTFLEGQGVSSAQIKLISFGENNPRCTQSDEECWSKNRRTAIRPTCRM